MPSYISTAKSPCIRHPDWYGLECPHFRKDKNLEPCNSCKLPSKYDDMLCKGPKRFTDSLKSGGASNQYSSRSSREALKLGYATIGDAVEAMIKQGMTHQQIADSIDSSRQTVSRIMKGRKR